MLNSLRNLERSELVDRKAMFLNRSKGARLFVTDEYIRFVSRWLKDSEATTYAAFNRIFSSQSYAAWQGFDFEDVACFRARKKAIQDLLKTKRKPEHFINYCFIVRNGIKRNRYFNEINPLVADISRVV